MYFIFFVEYKVKKYVFYFKQYNEVKHYCPVKYNTRFFAALRMTVKLKA